jgi:tetratricopeptide (TPR) repeat protein
VSSNDWEQTKALFNAALDIAPNERAAFLLNSAGDNAELREAVARLLAAHDEDDAFMETPAAEMHAKTSSASEPEQFPDGGRIGQYRVSREIGRGGMGTVHLAYRDDGEFRHQVALKLVKRGMDTDMILRRFRYERQILADLDHPNIAQLYDGGTTDDGRPYFVMEYIEGDPIDAYCRRHGLDVIQRLKLFQSVCAAVQYAHQNLIVHRDIKTSNILVTAAGAPKLLDFGIAKLLDSSREESLTAAPLTMRALTPEYASPEQVRGDPITTASDVYSLGVLLYELLAGHRPYEVNSTRPEDIARTVCDTDPVPPSQAAGEAAPGMRRRLRGDLDTIVLMAMQKDPRRRYTSVQQLSDDIGRHLNRQPVIARRDTSGYRAARFIRRNRAIVATGVTVLASLVIGLAATMWQARVAQTERARAERRFSEVRSLATSFLFEIHDAIAPLPGSTPARGLLVKRALTSLDGLAKEAEGDPGLQKDLAAAYERVGQVQGNSYYSNLGDTKGALISYRKSLEIRKKLVLDNPQSLQLQYELASGYGGLADMNSAVGELAAAAKDYESAINIRRSLRAKNPRDTANTSAMAELYNFLGDTQGMDGYANLGDVSGALASYRQSVSLREELAHQSPVSVDYGVGLANSLMNLGFLSDIVGDSTGADEVRRAVGILERIVGTRPNDAPRRLELLSGYARLRSVLSGSGHLDDAIAVDRKTIGMLDEMIAVDPENKLLRRNRSNMTNWLGRDLRASGRSDLALIQHRKALDMSERLARADARSSEHQHDVAISHYLIAESLSDLRQDREALAEYRIAANSKESLRISEPTNSRHADDLALIYSGIGTILTRTSDYPAAAKMVDKAIPLAQAAALRNKTNMKARVNLASTYFGAGRLHASMAAPMASREEKTLHWREARGLFARSLDIWQNIARGRHLTDAQAKQLADSAHEIAICDQALAKLVN